MKTIDEINESNKLRIIDILLISKKHKKCLTDYHIKSLAQFKMTDIYKEYQITLSKLIKGEFVPFPSIDEAEANDFLNNIPLDLHIKECNNCYKNVYSAVEELKRQKKEDLTSINYGDHIPPQILDLISEGIISYSQLQYKNHLQKCTHCQKNYNAYFPNKIITFKPEQPEINEGESFTLAAASAPEPFPFDNYDDKIYFDKKEYKRIYFFTFYLPKAKKIILLSNGEKDILQLLNISLEGKIEGKDLIQSPHSFNYIEAEAELNIDDYELYICMKDNDNEEKLEINFKENILIDCLISAAYMFSNKKEETLLDIAEKISRSDLLDICEDFYAMLKKDKLEHFSEFFIKVLKTHQAQLSENLK